MRRAALLSVLALTACAHGVNVESPGRGGGATTQATSGSSPRAAFGVELKPAEPVPLLALDSSDGTALNLETLRVHVVVQGPLAYTKVRARFVNPSDRMIEGRFHVLLPPRSSLARLGMMVGGHMREAEAVESVVARMTYEETMHRRVDPLLVEQPRERELAARIAPIAMHEAKEVELEYSTELSFDKPFVVPLRGLSSIHQFELAIVEGTTERLHIQENDATPADVRHVHWNGATARAGDFIATRISSSLPPESQPLDKVVYLVDTSASADLEVAQTLLGMLPKGRVIAYDQTASFVGVEELRTRGALGVANLSIALDLAAKSGARRIVVLGGSTEGALDAKLVASMDRVDVLGTSTSMDARALRPIAKYGVVIDDAGGLGRADLVRRLSNRVQSAPVKIPDAIWQSADHVDVAPGEDRIVYAQLAPGRTKELESSEAIPHAVAAAKAEKLLLQGDKAKAQVVALARKHHLITPYTSLIVVENDREAALLKRNEARAADPPPAPERPAASPPSLRGAHHVAKAPSIRPMAVVQVNGRVPPEIIQRVVRLRFGSFKACYADGRRRDPKLAGRVVVKFVIGRDGLVRAAEDSGSEVWDRPTIDCMVKAFLQLQFPQPEGGIITVVYPLMLSDEADLPDPPAPVMPSPIKMHTPSAPYEPPPPPHPWSATYRAMREGPSSSPRTPLGFIALGEALEAQGDRERAARAYASLVELWPERTELARAAAVRIDHARAGDPLAIRLLRRVVVARPDQPSSHHLLGLTLLRAGDREGARSAFEAGAARGYEGRYSGSAELFRSDLALLDTTAPHDQLLSLAWETDTSELNVWATNDASAHLAGAPIAWANDGFGPALFHPFDSPDATNVRVALARRGMGGDPFGVVHVIKRNERGDVTVEPRPFEIMTEGATLDLGKL